MESAIIALLSVNVTISIFLYRELDEIKKAFLQILNAVEPDEEENDTPDTNTFM